MKCNRAISQCWNHDAILKLMENWEAGASLLPGSHPGLDFDSGITSWGILSAVGDFVFLPGLEIFFRSRMRLCTVHLRRMAVELSTVAGFCKEIHPQIQASSSLAEETGFAAFLVLSRSVIISFGVLKAFVENTAPDCFNLSSWQSHQCLSLSDWHSTIQLGSQKL